MSEVNVLMVCMGNICRSPLAHGLFEDLVEKAGLSERVRVDSAGTHAYHVGEEPDPRSQQTALRHGIDLSSQRARRVASEDFEQFDYILAMDRDNFGILMRSASPEHHHKIHMFLEFAPEMPAEEVPDPYYGGADGFDKVYDLVEAAAAGLLQHIRSNHF